MQAVRSSLTLVSRMALIDYRSSQFMQGPAASHRLSPVILGYLPLFSILSILIPIPLAIPTVLEFNALQLLYIRIANHACYLHHSSGSPTIFKCCTLFLKSKIKKCGLDTSKIFRNFISTHGDEQPAIYEHDVKKQYLLTKTAPTCYQMTSCLRLESPIIRMQYINDFQIYSYTPAAAYATEYTKIV